MGVFVGILSSKRVAISVIIVLTITTLIPVSQSEVSHAQIIQETSENPLDLQVPMIVADDTSLLNFSSYLGGSGDENSMSVGCDAMGNIYVAGTTTSRDFPLVNPLDDSYEGRFDEGFITKISPTGEIVYSSYIGGDETEEIGDIFVDDAGFVYLTGYTNSADFPIVNAADSTFDNGDVFVCKINPAGSAFVYSTFIGGSSGEYSRAIWVNEQGEAYIVGETYSSDFPTLNPFDSSLAGISDCFVTKLSQTGNTILYSTLIGGQQDEWARGISVDEEGAMYVTGTTWSNDFPTLNAVDSMMSGGNDAFALKLNPSGTSLNYSTFLGGNDVEEGQAIGVDAIGRSYVTGYTTSTNFPTARPLQSTYSGNLDGFLTVFNPDGISLNFSTYFGTSGAESPSDLVVNGVGSVYVCGLSNALPSMVLNSYDSIFNGAADAFVFRMDIDRRVVLIGTYLGGSFLDDAKSMSLDNNCTMYVCGQTLSDNFPMRNPVDSTYNAGGVNGYDGFVSVVTDSTDWDCDGIKDVEEARIGTNSRSPDTDFDLLGDYLEVYQLGTNPLTNCTYGNGTLDGDLDHDGDNLTNVEELYDYGTDLLNWDSDSDLLSDGFEVHVIGSLPTEYDSDFDSLSDWEEYMIYNTDCLLPDSDHDIMTDGYEVNNGLNPLFDDADEDLDGDMLTNLQEFLTGCFANCTDSDSDNMPDGWEVDYGLNPLVDDSGGDPDGDTLTNYEEFNYGTSPRANDSDFDLLSDDWEIQYGLNPLNPSDANLDNDNDELTNIQEYILGLDPTSNDTDSDFLPDAWEVIYGTNPLVDDAFLDNDSDELTNLEEFQHGCNPMDKDSDQDTLDDGYEVLILGTNPLSPDSDMDSLPDAWEVRYGLDPLQDDSMLDMDADGLCNLGEYEAGTRPDMIDTDSDSFSDAWEVRNGFDPLDSNLPLIQAFYYNFPVVLALFAVSMTLSSIYVMGRLKSKKEEQERQELLAMEIQSLLDSISDSLDSKD